MARRKHYRNEQLLEEIIMKKLVTATLLLGSIVAQAEEFKGPRLFGYSILASSDHDSVCKLLTHTEDSESSLVATQKFFFKNPAPVVKIKSSSQVTSKVLGGTFSEIVKLITLIKCN